MTFLEVTQLNERFKGADIPEILGWLGTEFKKEVVATSSFQTQSLPLLHLMSLHCPEVKIFFLDTGFHFKETLEFVSKLRSDFGLRIETLRPLLSNDDFLEQYGGLYQKDPEMCCYLNKVEPMTRALKGASAWISGVRHDQTKTRASMQLFNLQPDGILKICPIIDWNQKMIDDYITENSLPVHPLLSKGYRSIGCAPCSRPTLAHEDPREGRWSGTAKTECGLHEKYPHLFQATESPRRKKS